MARVRPANRCTARRTNGQPCGNYSIHGGTVCAAHGGRSPQVRAAARARVVESQLRRGFAVSWARHRRALAEWNVDRIVATAELLGMPVEKVTRADIVECHLRYGWPPLSGGEPQIKYDRRYGPRPTARRRRDG